MQRIAFHQLPRWVRVAAALTLFNTWVVIAEFVIDRYGLDEHLPFYKYGDVCIWDIAVIIGIAIWYVRASKIPRNVDGTSAG
jgi:hypothetical protein